MRTRDHTITPDRPRLVAVEDAARTYVEAFRRTEERRGTDRARSDDDADVATAHGALLALFPEEQPGR